MTTATRIGHYELVRVLAAAAVVAVLLAAGCNGGTSSGAEIAPGVHLQSTSKDGRRLSVAWVVRDELETVATDGAVVYVVGAEVTALRASDGVTLWRYTGPHGDPLSASGGVGVGRSSAAELEVFAPFEYDLKLDQQTGRELTYAPTTSGDAPSSFTAFGSAPTRDFRVERRSNDHPEVQVSDSTGQPLATLAVDTANFDEPPPMQVGDVLIVSLTSGDVVGLRLLT